MKKLKTTPTPKAPSEPWNDFQLGQKSKQVKRELVLETAARLFLEHGYQKTSMSLLSSRLKITKPALYYYFHNKEDILVECYRAGIAAIEGYLHRASPSAGTGLSRLRLYIHGYATAVLTHDFGRCVAMIDDLELSIEARRGVRELKRGIDISIRKLVEAGIKDGSISLCNPKMVSFAVAGAINWAGTWYKPDGELSSDEIAQHFVRILAGGLGSPVVEERKSSTVKSGKENPVKATI